MPGQSALAAAAGLALWCALTALGLFAGWMLAAALAPGRGLLLRWQVALTAFLCGVLTCVQGLAWFGALDRPRLVIGALLVFSTELAIARSLAAAAPEPVDLRALATRDVLALPRLWREGFRAREPLLLPLAAGTALLAMIGLSIWYLRSWTWDGLWYHVPIVDLLIQEKTLSFYPGPNLPFAQGYAKAVEMLSVWTVLLPGNSRLGDAAQLPFAALGMLALARWARRMGATRPFAAGCAALWLLAPPVFLQLGSTYNDVACAGTLIAGWVALTEPTFEGLELWLCAAGFALAAACKFTGMFQFSLVLPLVLGRACLSILRGHRRRFGVRRKSVQVAAAALVVSWIGGFVYLRNWIIFNNPIYPMHTRIPFFGEVAGPTDPLVEWTKPFFRTPGTLGQMLHSWIVPFAALWPDVRTGGFGPLWRWVTLPALSVAVLLLLRRRARADAATTLGLFVLAVVVPDPAWPRYVLAAPAAGIGAFALLHDVLRPRWLRLCLSLAAAAAGLSGLYQGLPPMGPGLADLSRAMHADPVLRHSLQLVRWQWPQPAALLRETELREGEAIAYDDSVSFSGELWTRDLRNRAVYLAHAQDQAGRDPRPIDPSLDADYLRRLRAANAVWAAVRSGGAAARALLASGATPLFACPVSDAVVYRLKRESH